MIAGLIRSLVGGFFGTIGFALLLHAPKKAWLPASAIGGVSFALYWFLLRIGWGEAAAIFTAALGGSLWAQWCARRMRMIATIFITLSIVSLVPGLGLYRCMELIGQEQNALGLQTGAAAMYAPVIKGAQQRKKVIGRRQFRIFKNKAACTAQQDHTRHGDNLNTQLPRALFHGGNNRNIHEENRPQNGPDAKEAGHQFMQPPPQGLAGDQNQAEKQDRDRKKNNGTNLIALFLLFRCKRCSLLPGGRAGWGFSFSRRRGTARGRRCSFLRLLFGSGRLCTFRYLLLF